MSTETTTTYPARDPKRTELILALKTTLNAFAAKFREDRKQGRGKNLDERFAWRCHHIVYCMLRGKTLEQIENHRLKKTYAGDSEDKLQKTIAEMLDVVDKGDYDLQKLYVFLTVPNLKPSEQAVQMGHGVALFMDTYPGVWRNTTLVYLEQPQGGFWYQLRNMGYRLGFWTTSWQEPDLKFAFTSTAAFGLLTQRAFKQCQLLGSEQQKKIFGMIG